MAGAIYHFTHPDPLQLLEPYMDQDLRNLSEEEQLRFDSLISHLAPEAKTFAYPSPPQSLDLRGWWNFLKARPLPGRRLFCPESWYLWQVTNDCEEGRLVLFQGRPLFMIPGNSSARVFVFDGRGNLLSQSDFLTGYRNTIEDAHWLSDCGHGFPCILVDSHNVINGHDVAAQYYALLEDTVALVRLESSTGEFETTIFSTDHFRIGPDFPVRTPAQCEVALHSRNRAEVLRTLVWLGGGHYPDYPGNRMENRKRFEEATRALETRSRQDVRAAVEALTSSEDSWVREAAQRAWKAIQGHSP
jgi:hypothetical protein